MRIILVVFCLNLFNLIGHAQNLVTDSLIHELTLVKHDTTRILIMSDLSLNYRLMKIDSSMKYGMEALELAQRTNYLRGEAMALYSLAYLNREMGELPKALNLILKALKMAEENQYLEIMSLSNTLIGAIYFDLSEFVKAIGYYRKAILINRQRGENISLLPQHLNIGASYLRMNNLDSGKYYLGLAKEKALTLPSHQRSQAFTGILRNLAMIEEQSNNDKLALDYFKRSIESSSFNNDYRNMSLNSNELARFYLRLSNLDSCIYHAERGLYYGQSGPYNKRILESCMLLTEAFKIKNDFEKAYEYQNLMVKAKEGLFSAGNIQAMQRMISEEEGRRKELEAEKIAYQNKLKQYAFIAGIIILLLIALLLYRNNRKEKKAKEILEIKNEEIQRTLTQLKSTQSQLIQSEKMASLGELTAGIAHEIQNPLNFVNNFSEVSNELIGELKTELATGNRELATELANDISGNLEKINHHGKRAADIVKGMLQHSRSSSGQKEPTDINALADEYLRLAYHGLRAKDKSFNATMKTDFDETIGNINVVPQDIGRVILNLITNAFYVVSEKSKLQAASYEPLVIVSTKKLGGKIEISVKDNGNGIPQKILDKIFQPFFTTKPTGQGTGLGLSLSYDIVTKAHQGEIKVSTKEGEGTEFIVVLPC